MIRAILSFFGGIFTLITLGILGVIIGIGGIFWVYGRDLPSHTSLEEYQPPIISRIYSSEGRLIDEFARERRLFAAAEDIPPLIKHAFISAEDKNFYTHPGYDLRGIISAIFDAARSGGKRVRGASTIPQQVMKNFLLDGERRAERKVKEIILATRVENTLSKEQILELYLNEIFLGQNSYGVTAAAQTYFNKTLDELMPHEAAFLASLPKAPSDYHPVRRKDRLLMRRNYVLREMWQNGYLDTRTYKLEKEMPLKSVQNGDFESFRSVIPPRDYFTDEIRRQLSKDFGEETFFTGGMTIRATLDPELQVKSRKALQRALEAYDRNQGEWRGTGLSLPKNILIDENAWRTALKETSVPRDIDLDGKWYPAVVLSIGKTSARIGIEGVLDDEDGHWISKADVNWARKIQEDGKIGPKAKVAKDLLAVGDVVLVRRLFSKDGIFERWSLRQISEVQGAFMAMDVNSGRILAMQGGFSYGASVFNRATQADRQPGSSFKPFVYAAALDIGYSPATIIVDAPIEMDTPEGLWTPKNSSKKFYGPTPLRTGIEQSRNLMTIRLAQVVGMDIIGEYAERFGVYNNMRQFLANSLGAEETTLYRMVAAYAMFANGGERVVPTLVDRVQDRYGKTVYRHDPRVCYNCDNQYLPVGQAPELVSNRERVMDAITAYQLTSMMEGVVQRGTARNYVKLPVPAAGKTGTTNDAKDVWFVGFTSNIVAGCYIGHDIPKPLGKGYFGGSACGPVFNDFMIAATEKYGGSEFTIPEGGQFINIDRLTGSRLTHDIEEGRVVAEYFRDGSEPVFGERLDGGFAMGSNFELITPEDAIERTVVTSTGEKGIVGSNASIGTVASGGLY
ncbi:MAG: penicillin-binding protein [Rhodobacteraceae bacterium]|nr:penicillin-binding protein [Paracoccaceae bacterium]